MERSADRSARLSLLFFRRGTVITRQGQKSFCHLLWPYLHQKILSRIASQINHTDAGGDKDGMNE